MPDVPEAPGVDGRHHAAHLVVDSLQVRLLAVVLGTVFVGDLVGGVVGVGNLPVGVARIGHREHVAPAVERVLVDAAAADPGLRDDRVQARIGASGVVGRTHLGDDAGDLVGAVECAGVGAGLLGGKGQCAAHAADEGGARCNACDVAVGYRRSASAGLPEALGSAVRSLPIPC